MQINLMQRGSLCAYFKIKTHLITFDIILIFSIHRKYYCQSVKVPKPSSWSGGLSHFTVNVFGDLSNGIEGKCIQVP